MSRHVFDDQPGGLRLVGDFEALYAEESDPWSQSAESGEMAAYYDFSRRRLVESLRAYSLESGLEIGCGHGHVAAEIQRTLCIRMTGMDVSPSAVARATVLHPAQSFFTGDLISGGLELPAKFGFVLWGQIFWYVLHRFSMAIRNTLRCVEKGGLLVVSQAFLREQRYGTEIADGFEGTLRLFDQYRDRLRLIEARYDDSNRFVHHDGLLVFRVI